MSEHVPAELLDEPPAWAYAAAALLTVGVFVAFALTHPDHLALLSAAAGVNVALSCLSGFLFWRKGYTAAEGFFAGLLIWPVSVPFGIWGPPSQQPPPPDRPLGS